MLQSIVAAEFDAIIAKTIKIIFKINIKSNQPMPDNQELLNMAYKFGTHGTIKFTFTNIGGTYHVTKQGITPQYDFAKNKNLNWLKINIPFIPDFIKSGL